MNVKINKDPFENVDLQMSLALSLIEPLCLLHEIVEAFPNFPIISISNHMSYLQQSN